MLFVSVDDFYEKTAGIAPLSRAEERRAAQQMGAGDPAARETLIRAYLPMTAAHIRRLPRRHQTLELVYRCLQALVKAVDGFNFLQDGEPFSHRLNWSLRQTVVRYIADQREQTALNLTQKEGS